MCTRNWIPGFVGLLAITNGCASGRSPAPAPDRIAGLTSALAVNRARLDSIVGGINRLSGDTSQSSIRTMRELKSRAASLDSSYRMRFADLWLAVNASSGAANAGESHFRVEMAPAPFVRAFADGSHWMLQSPLVQELGKTGADVIVVPRGFVTDFASIPQPLQVLRGVRTIASRYASAALVHDYLYWTQDCTREQADRIMELAMKEAGIPFLERKIIYEGLRQFGQTAWDEHRAARQSGFIKIVGPPYDLVPPTGTWQQYREWLRSVRARSGSEYHVSRRICELGDADES